MRVMNRMTCLWPGLTRLWWRGEFSALSVALSFAILLNLLLFQTVWHAVDIHVGWTWGGWLICLAVWCHGIWRGSGRHEPRGLEIRQAQEDLLNRAQAEYLKGDWSKAQALLEQQLRRNPDDFESHLLLSSVFRRSGRIELARRKLEQASRLEGAERWELEIRRERAILDRRQQAAGENAVAGTRAAK